MEIDKRCLKKITKVFQELSLPLRLLDADGVCVVPADGEDCPRPAASLAVGLNHRSGELLLRALDVHPSMLLAAQADAPGAGDVLCVADALIMSLLKNNLSISGFSEVYRKALRQELSGQELAARAAEQQIPMEQDRCVLLFQLGDPRKSSAYNLLGELLPLSETDVLVELNRREVALIKDMQGLEGAEEAEQYVLAVQETLMEEAALPVIAGVGDVKSDLSSIGESYAEAKRAIEVGLLFSPEESVFVFSRLMLERFLTSTPREECLRYHSLLFNRKTARLFNEEMLQTIEMFFRKDLNLSDTARQLFIHRNTLVYRLDKVQRQTGLDLRHFDDAVTFKILYKLKRCSMEKPKEIL